MSFTIDCRDVARGAAPISAGQQSFATYLLVDRGAHYPETGATSPFGFSRGRLSAVILLQILPPTTETN